MIIHGGEEIAQTQKFTQVRGYGRRSDNRGKAISFDGEDLFFGYVILIGDEQSAEWGYFSWQELHDLEIGPLCVEIDGGWVTKRFGELGIAVAS